MWESVCHTLERLPVHRAPHVLLNSPQSISKNLPILLANLLQRSRTAFSCVSFASFFAFKEGMYDTQTSAVLSSPTVSHRFSRLDNKSVQTEALLCQSL